MVQDVIKGDAGVVTADISLVNTRLDELEDKVSKMEQWLTNLQTITDMLAEDVAAPTAGITAMEEKEEAEVAAAAEPVETKDVIVPYREKEENAKEVANKIRRVTPEKLAARVGLMSNKFNDFAYKN